MAEVREFLLAIERVHEPLDTAITSFASSLSLSPHSVASPASDDASVARTRQFLALDPHCSLLLRIWPDPSSSLGKRWQQRDTIARFLHLVTHFIHSQRVLNKLQAETICLGILREKLPSLEKFLSWSDKPRIEYHALVLLTAICTVSGAIAREFVRRWPFHSPNFQKLASRRWKKVENSDNSVPNPPFQLRQAYVDLVLALTTCPEPSVFRFAVKEGGITSTLGQSLESDGLMLLQTMWPQIQTHVLENPALDRKSKVNVCTPTWLYQLVAVLKDDEKEEKVREFALEMLSNLCFDSKAVYHIPQDKALALFLSKTKTFELETSVITSDERYALQVIRKVVASIGLTDLLQRRQAQTFVEQFVTIYPGYLADYLTALSLPLEPKPVFRWFQVISLLQMLLKCPLDAVHASFDPSTTSWTAKTLATRLIVPGMFRKELSRSLQHGNQLVVYAALGVVQVVLERYQSVVSCIRASFLPDVQAELRNLVPSPQVLVSLLLKLVDSKNALLYIRALAVFALYQVCLPSELKVEVAKLLAWQEVENALKSDEASIPRLQWLCIGEMLRFLVVLEPSRVRSLFTSRSKLENVLQLYVMNKNIIVHTLARRVLERTFLALDTFGLDTTGQATEEVAIWLDSLAHSRDKACATVVEHFLTAVQADPLLYVQSGRLEKWTTAAVSPMTSALIRFLQSSNETATLAPVRTTETATLYAAARTNPSVVAFCMRILLAVLPLSHAPHQLVALIAGQDDEMNSKKRKRAEDEEARDGFGWLQLTCQALLSGQKSSFKNSVRPNRIAWRRVDTPEALKTALLEISSYEFALSWQDIVENCTDVGESYELMFHYLSARGDVDLLAIALAPAKDARVKAFQQTLPLSLVLQHVLFRLETTENDVYAGIPAIVAMVEHRIKTKQVEPNELVRMCEQLLFYFTLQRTRNPLLVRLCELLMMLVSRLLLVSYAQERTRMHRIVQKIEMVQKKTCTTNAYLWRHLAAVELVTRRLLDARLDPTTTLDDLEALYCRASVPVVALAASQLPCRLRLDIVEKLVDESIHTTASGPHRVVLECLLRSLRDEPLDSFQNVETLACKLWKLLEHQSNTWTLENCTTGFLVVQRCGGVEESTVLTSLSTWLAPLIVQSARTGTSWNECCTLVRAIVRTRKCPHESNAFKIALENALGTLLDKEANERVTCIVLRAMYDVFWRLATLKLYERAYKWSVQCVQRLVLRSEASEAMELELLQHVMLEDSFQTNAEAWQTLMDTTIKDLAKTVRTEKLTSLQLLALLSGLRRVKCLESADKLLVILVQSVLTSVQDDKSEYLSSQVDATLWLVDQMVEMVRVQDQRKQQATCQLLGPLSTRLCDAMRHASHGFEALVGVLAAFLTLHVDENKVFVTLYDLLVEHEKFVPSLENRSNEPFQLVLVRVLAQLLRRTGKYTRSLLQTLLRAYTMSLSPFDRSLRVLFAAFEAQEREDLTVRSLGFRFGLAMTNARVDLVDDSKWILDGGLDVGRLRATIDAFPLDRELSTIKDARELNLSDEVSSSKVVDEMLSDKIPSSKIENVYDQNVSSSKQSEKPCYDPAFLLPLLASFLASSEWSDSSFVQQGFLGLALRATSSTDEGIREYAYGILAHVYESFQATCETSSEWKAGRQVVLLLSVFRQGLKHPLAQIPSLITVFLNDTLTVLTRPTHVLYPHVNQFLLARPALDCHDVPMFYALFHSRSPVTVRQERSWLLHLLRRGICTDDDVALLDRRHVLPLLLSFFPSDMADAHTQALILEILHATLRTVAGGLYLVTKTGVLMWLSTQLVPLSVRTKNSSTLVLSLMLALQYALEEHIWQHLDSRQQETAALQAVQAFDQLYAALIVQRSQDEPNDQVRTKAAELAVLVVRRVKTKCSLAMLDKAVTMIQYGEAIDPKLAFAETLARQWTPWILEQGHFQATKAYFPLWATLYHHVVQFLSSIKLKGSRTQQQRAQNAFRQVTTGLQHLPTIQKLVRTVPPPPL